MDVISFSNVNQTSDGAAFPHTASGNSVTTSTITSAPGNKIVSAMSYAGSLAANIRGTVIYKDTVVAVYRSAAAYDVGAGSVTIGQDNVNGNLAGVDVKAF
jgi:hypothetical protein